MTSNKPSVYAGSIALEKNRWSSRVPSIYLPEWMGRFAADGFDGAEVWEEHYTSLNRDARRAVRDSGLAIIFNAYCLFDGGLTDHHRRVAECITECGAVGVKYNIGAPETSLAAQTETFLQWVTLLPDHVRLLCECHQGTQMEEPVTAAAFFEPLDAKRFGAIQHLSADDANATQQMEAYGSRIWHVHTQSRINDALIRLDDDPSVSEQRLQRVFRLPELCSITIEFTRDGATPEETYQNMFSDKSFIHTAMGAFFK